MLNENVQQLCRKSFLFNAVAYHCHHYPSRIFIFVQITVVRQERDPRRSWSSLPLWWSSSQYFPCPLALMHPDRKLFDRIRLCPSKNLETSLKMQFTRWAAEVGQTKNRKCSEYWFKRTLPFGQVELRKHWGWEASSKGRENKEPWCFEHASWVKTDMYIFNFWLWHFPVG